MGMNNEVMIMWIGEGRQCEVCELCELCLLCADGCELRSEIANRSD